MESLVLDNKYTDFNDKNYGRDVESAVRTFLDASIGDRLYLSPQAVNPFIRSLEGMGLWKQACIMPMVKTGESNKPVYVVVKVPDTGILELKY